MAEGRPPEDEWRALMQVLADSGSPEEWRRRLADLDAMRQRQARYTWLYSVGLAAARYTLAILLFWIAFRDAILNALGMGK